MSQEDKLENPFKSTPTKDDGFIAFSSTPLPNHESGSRQFRPKRGKYNRQANWRDFAAHNQQQFRGRGNNRSPYNNRGRGFQNNSPSHLYSNNSLNNTFNSFNNSSDNSFYNSPNNSYNNQSFRGGRRNNRGGGNGTPKPYFHPSMLEDPWKHLEDGDYDKMSDSLIPQVDDSLFDRNVEELMNKNNQSSLVNPAPELLNDTVDESLMVNTSGTSGINDLTVSSEMNTSNNDTVDESLQVQIGDSTLETTTN